MWICDKTIALAKSTNRELLLFHEANEVNSFTGLHGTHDSRILVINTRNKLPLESPTMNFTS